MTGASSRSLRALGWHVDVLDLGEGFPAPDAAAARDSAARGCCSGCRQAARSWSTDWRSACCRTRRGSFARRHPLVALVHHPLALETGLADGRSRELCARANARRWPAPAHVVVTSAAPRGCSPPITACRRTRSPWRRPGTDRRAPAHAAARRRRCGCLSVGSIVPRKGYDVLIAALATLADLPWRLTIAGDRTRDPETAAQLDADIARHRS